MKRHVEIESRGKILRGYLELPDVLPEGGKAPLVMMLHGFSGDRCERHFFLARLSRHLVAQGVGTLRVDTAGSGESDGEFCDMTPRTRMEDAFAILDFAMAQEQVDSSRIMLLGYSNGGFVSANVAARRRDDVSRLVLVSASCRSHKAMEEAKRDTGMPARGSLVVSDKFIADGYELDSIEAAARYDRPVTIIQGTADVNVLPSAAKLYAETFENCELQLVEGADHAYDTPEYFARLCDLVSAAVL